MKPYLRIFIFLLLLPGMRMRASTCTAVANGNWSSPATWSCGRVPGNNDTIWVPSGKTVTVDFNSPTYVNMLVVVDGTLDFGNGNKLNICPGGVFLSSTGLLTGGTPGSKINICATTVWNGPGPTGGPTSFGTVILPVELVSFEGKKDGMTLQLSWQTASENNNSFFTVERSTNGMTFEDIGHVNGSGTTSQPHDYTFADNSPQTGTNYYRLSQTDINGQVTHFNIIAVEFSSDNAECVLTVFPNPCDGNCNVSLSDCPSDNGVMTMELVDASGQIVSSKVPERNANGGFTTSIDSKNNLKPGVYIVRGRSEKAVYQQKAVLK